VAPGERLEALRSANVKSLAARRLAVIALPLDDWLQEDFASLNAAHTVFQICIPEGGVTDDWLAGLQRIRDSGAGVALSCIEFKANLAPALALATHAFVDFAASSVEKFECLVKDLRQSYPALTLAVDNVATWPERRLCMALGVEFAMGDFLSTVDAQEKGEKLTESRMVLMEMLNLVRNDGDVDALAGVAKRDPGVAVRLLSMANSPAYGLTKPLTGIDQAIVLLGRETLYRWLAVSIFRAGGDSARDKALLEVALARARFLELVALSVGSKQQADELFLVGLLSFVDTLLGMPMKDIVASMSLPPVVRDALLSGEGPYALYLLLVVSVEKCRPERAAQLAGALGIDLDGLSQHRTAALLWAEEAVV
jgi:EAL and modified HD-GYP domain-containing signal transduction protein